MSLWGEGLGFEVFTLLLQTKVACLTSRLKCWLVCTRDHKTGDRGNILPIPDTTFRPDKLHRVHQGTPTEILRSEIHLRWTPGEHQRNIDEILSKCYPPHLLLINWEFIGVQWGGGGTREMLPDETPMKTQWIYMCNPHPGSVGELHVRREEQRDEVMDKAWRCMVVSRDGKTWINAPREAKNYIIISGEWNMVTIVISLLPSLKSLGN